MLVLLLFINKCSERLFHTIFEVTRLTWTRKFLEGRCLTVYKTKAGTSPGIVGNYMSKNKLKTLRNSRVIRLWYEGSQLFDSVVDVVPSPLLK